MNRPKDMPKVVVRLNMFKLIVGVCNVHHSSLWIRHNRSSSGIEKITGRVSFPPGVDVYNRFYHTFPKTFPSACSRTGFPRSATSSRSGQWCRTHPGSP